jgi:hypothetical protein
MLRPLLQIREVSQFAWRVGQDACSELKERCSETDKSGERIVGEAQLGGVAKEMPRSELISAVSRGIFCFMGLNAYW